MQPKFEGQSSSYKRGTGLAILFYVNKADVFCLHFEYSMFRSKMNRKTQKNCLLMYQNESADKNITIQLEKELKPVYLPM